MMNQFSDHEGFVQGVAWDPLDEYIISQGADQTCRIYQRDAPSVKKWKKYHTLKQRKEIHYPSSNELIPDESTNVLAQAPVERQHQLFLDGQAVAFFRRLWFSCEGSFLLTPAGQFKDLSSSEAEEKVIPSVYIFHRSNLKRPVMYLPSQFPVLAIRFSPVFYSLRNPAGFEPLHGMNYRMYFAIVTKETVAIYDTEQFIPLTVIQNIHFAPLTDIAWFGDGRSVLVSSEDGYCTLITLAAEALGILLPESDKIAIQAACIAKREAAVAVSEEKVPRKAADKSESVVKKKSVKTEVSREEVEKFVLSSHAEGKKITIANVQAALEISNNNATKIFRQLKEDGRLAKPKVPLAVPVAIADPPKKGRPKKSSTDSTLTSALEVPAIHASPTTNAAPKAAKPPRKKSRVSIDPTPTSSIATHFKSPQAPMQQLSEGVGLIAASDSAIANSPDVTEIAEQARASTAIPPVVQFPLFSPSSPKKDDNFPAPKKPVRRVALTRVESVVVTSAPALGKAPDTAGAEIIGNGLVITRTASPEGRKQLPFD
jgi:chromatin assembly factor 1 subunit B